MKLLLVAVALMYLVGVESSYWNWTAEQCAQGCTNEQYPVCAMEVRVNKRIFENDCIMWRENECNGGKFVYCENWMN